MIWHTTLVASLLALGAQAGGLGSLIAEGMTRNSPSVERRMHEIAKSSLLSRGWVEPRQQTQGNAPLLNADGTINMQAWDQQTNRACIDALRQLPQASNPSGTCVCYNLPALDNRTGTFQADLRLYRLGMGTGDFLGIPPVNIQVGLTYRGASVSPVSMGRLSGAAGTGATGAGTAAGAGAGAAAVPGAAGSVAAGNSPLPGASAAAGASPIAARQVQADTGMDLDLLQTYLFIGQIDKDRMTPDITMAELQAFVMPIVTLSGTNAQGQRVSTNVSSNEAVFVNGVFSQEVVMSSFRLAELAVEEEVARLKNGTTAFVLPGVQIMIFPIGLIITGLWTVIFCVAYGMGTYDRYHFREAYKARMARAEKAGVATF